MSKGWQQSHFEILRGFYWDFFYGFYKRIPGDRCIPYITDWPCVTPNQNLLLVTRFLEEEIFKAVKALGGNKAPRSDGFIKEFLVKHGLKSKGSFKNLFDDFHINVKLNACIQENFICLIQKKEDVIHVRDFRLISLTTITYKVVAKVLADRLKGVMDSIISPFQSAFIEGRQVLDPILIANEVVEDYQAKGKKGWILKLDLEKAFDRVDWGFLVKV